MADRERLQTTFSTPDLAWLVEKARRHLERGGSVSGMLSLSNPTPEQRRALDSFFSRPPSKGARLAVRLADLDECLRRYELCDGVVAAVELLTGPLVDRRGEATRLREQWDRLFSEAEARLPDRDKRREWLRDLRTSGLLKRLSGNDASSAAPLLQYAVEIVLKLPAEDVPLTVLAAQVASSSHALDPGQPLAALVIRAARFLGDVTEWKTASSRRAAWESLGVLCDELSAPLLTLNLRGDADSLTGRALAMHAAGGEPYRVSVRQLRRDPPAFNRAVVGPVVYVCENPSVVDAAANHCRSHSAPLVCIDGQPKTAARLLFDRLTSAGIRLAYHGDFDWGGITIGNHMIERHQAVPWRFRDADYRTAAMRGTKLSRKPVLACWDAQLSATMQATGRAVHEEQVIDQLVADLAKFAGDVAEPAE